MVIVGNQQILFAMHDVEVPFLVMPDQIAGMEPAFIIKHTPSCFRVVIATGTSRGAFGAN